MTEFNNEILVKLKVRAQIRVVSQVERQPLSKYEEFSCVLTTRREFLHQKETLRSMALAEITTAYKNHFIKRLYNEVPLKRKVVGQRLVVDEIRDISRKETEEMK